MGAPQTTLAINYHQSVENMNGPIPSNLSQGAFPKSMQHGLSSTMLTHWTTSVNIVVDPPPPFIHCKGSMLDQLEQPCFFLGPTFIPHSIPSKFMGMNQYLAPLLHT
jgi:hypothetical protein